MKDWYDESKHYNVEKEESALKYSQLVWKNSKRMGVGHAYSNERLYVIVLYDPSGNLRGEFGKNVGCNSLDQQKKNK